MKTPEEQAKAASALKLAIRAFTVDKMEAGQHVPNGPAEEASLRLSLAMLALPPSAGREIWRLAEIHAGAEADRLRDLRVAAEAFFGEDFKRPKADLASIMGFTIEPTAEAPVPPKPITASDEKLLQMAEDGLRARLYEAEVAGFLVPGSSSVERVPAPADAPAGTPGLSWQGKPQGTIRPLAVRTTDELPPGEPTQLDWMRAVAKVLDTALAQRIWPPKDSSERITTWNEAIQATRWEVLRALQAAAGLLPGMMVVPPMGRSWTRGDLGGRGLRVLTHPDGAPVAAAASAEAAETLLLYLNGLEMDRGWLLNRVDQLARALVWAIGEEDPAHCRYCFPPSETSPPSLCQAHQALKKQELPAPPGRLPPASDVAAMRAAFMEVRRLKKRGATREVAKELGLLDDYLMGGSQELIRIVWERADKAFGVDGSML